MSKSRAVGFGILVVVIALAVSGLSKLFDSGGGGGVLPGSGTGISSGTPTTPASDASGPLVIRVEGEQYWVDGKPRSLDEVVAAAVARSPKLTGVSETQVLVKKKNARASLIEKLEDELNRRGIRYRTEDDYR